MRDGLEPQTEAYLLSRKRVAFVSCLLNQRGEVRGNRLLGSDEARIQTPALATTTPPNLRHQHPSLASFITILLVGYRMRTYIKRMSIGKL
jgi:hypothetical protein